MMRRDRAMRGPEYRTRIRKLRIVESRGSPYAIVPASRSVRSGRAHRSATEERACRTGMAGRNAGADPGGRKRRPDDARPDWLHASAEPVLRPTSQPEGQRAALGAAQAEEG
jgi:hypothetical protein